MYDKLLVLLTGSTNFVKKYGLMDQPAPAREVDQTLFWTKTPEFSFGMIGWP